jgi:hypothetical protein
MSRQPRPPRRARLSRSRLRARLVRALLFLVPIDRGKRIDRHIDYFGSGALAAGSAPDRPAGRR